MTRNLVLAVKDFKNEAWCALSSLGIGGVDVVAYKVKKVDDQFTFEGNHKVRLFRFWDNVHFKIPTGVKLNIEAVPMAAAPPTRRHDRRR
jgi:hypothetical protein